ncbi:hypothetical protein ACOMHN_028902 [Nucella lapillus]
MVAPLRLVEGREGGEPSGAGSVPGSKPSITEQGFASTPHPKHKNCVRGTHPNRPWPKRRREKRLKSPLAFGRGCLHGTGHAESDRRQPLDQGREKLSQQEAVVNCVPDSQPEDQHQRSPSPGSTSTSTQL